MKLVQATEIAQRIAAMLAPRCERIEIAGSIRRRKQVKADYLWAEIRLWIRIH
jgi:DNA polymerase/3'-5' exonuclease PolX